MYASKQKPAASWTEHLSINYQTQSRKTNKEPVVTTVPTRHTTTYKPFETRLVPYVYAQHCQH